MRWEPWSSPSARSPEARNTFAVRSGPASFGRCRPRCLTSQPWCKRSTGLARPCASAACSRKLSVPGLPSTILCSCGATTRGGVWKRSAVDHLHSGTQFAVCSIRPHICRLAFTVICSGDVPVEYCGEEQAICSVGLLKPRPGVFLEAIQHIIVLCTTTEVRVVFGWTTRRAVAARACTPRMGMPSAVSVWWAGEPGRRQPQPLLHRHCSVVQGVMHPCYCSQAITCAHTSCRLCCWACAPPARAVAQQWERRGALRCSRCPCTQVRGSSQLMTRLTLVGGCLWCGV